MREEQGGTGSAAEKKYPRIISRSYFFSLPLNFVLILLRFFSPALPTAPSKRQTANVSKGIILERKIFYNDVSF